MPTTFAATLTGIASAAVVVLGAAASLRASGAAAAALTLLALGVALALATLDVNCTFTGQCSVWGWIKTAVLLLYLSAALALEVNILSQPAKAKVDKKQE